MAAAWVDVLTVACRRKHRIRVVVAVAIVVLCVWSLAFKSPSDNLEVVPRIANVLKGSGVAGGSPLKEHAKAREYPDFDYKEDAKGQKEEALKEESAAARLSRGKGEDGKDEKIESHSDKKQLAIKKRRKTLNGVVVSDNHSEFDVIGSVDVFSSVNQPVDKRYDEFAEDDAKVVPGVGEDGAPVVLAHDEDDLAKKVMAKEAFNIVASDKISLHRRVPDTRDPRCRNVSYDHDLPTASVIIIFTNEAWTPLLRTIWSVLDQTPAEYLKEIILVDDFSDKKHLKGKLERYIQRRFPSKVRLKRLLKRSGLIRARLAGASLATGDVLLFLDSHCECGKNWIQPLLQRIKEEPKAFVVPIIDVIDDKTMEYYHGNGIYFQIGGFTWSGHFNWIDIPAHEDSRRGSPVGPTRTPTMAGGLFAVLKKSFYDLGSYDEEMDVWGGENLEMSFRVWQCGGSVEIIPCSRVGHIFRSFHPYTFPGNKVGEPL
jgi:polypeptide N-acetylgalactosaminyltransferase